MNNLALLTTILQLVPALIGAIKAVEAAIPGEGKGEQKLAAVRQIIEAVYTQASWIMPSIEAVVGILVALFNKTGVFSKSPEPVNG